MLRWLTAGESHGQALVSVVEGMVAGITVTSSDIAAELARRRLGYGRGARMKFEQDAVTVLGGIRHGRTLGSAIAILIGNTEWPKWQHVMSPDPVDPALLDGARNTPLTRPRPGHADYAGMLKFGFTDARPVLERASARETAARVAAGAIAKAFLRQTLGVEVISHVVAIGEAEAPAGSPVPAPSALADIDASPVRAATAAAQERMLTEIEAAKREGDTLGGVFEVCVHGLPVGLGSHTSGDSRIDGQLAQALMSIPAIKGVEVGDGFRSARRRGSHAHDEIYPGSSNGGEVHRRTNRAGGIEGGMTNGEVMILRAAMKPISTVPRALSTIDIETNEPASAIHQRSDVCAVPAAGVVGEAMVALVLARAALAKLGGDSLAEINRTNRVTPVYPRIELRRVAPDKLHPIPTGLSTFGWCRDLAF